MSNFTDYVEEQIVNWMVGGEDMPTAHTNVYVSLHTNDPTNSGEENEVTVDSYSRVETTANGDWNRTEGTFENAVDIEFPEAQENWGNISHFALWDAEESATDDNAIAQSSLQTARDVEEGDVAVFRSGNLTGEVQ